MSEEAEDNLKAVIEYISIELKMPHAASNLYYKIKNLIQSLATMPERFKEYDKEKYKSYNLRMVSVDNYCIFYTVAFCQRRAGKSGQRSRLSDKARKAECVGNREKY